MKRVSNKIFAHTNLTGQETVDKKFVDSSDPSLTNVEKTKNYKSHAGPII